MKNKKVKLIFTLCMIFILVFQNVSFLSASSSLSSPVIFYPTNGTRVAFGDIIVSWGAVNGASRYAYAVRNTTSGKVIIFDSFTNQNYFIIPSSLLTENNDYRIFVAAEDAYTNQYPSYSVITVFKESRKQLTPPNITSPRSMSIVSKDSGSIRVAWDYVSNTTGYWIGVWRADNGQFVYDNSGRATSNNYIDIPANLLEYNTTYKFAVTASAVGWENASSELYFATNSKTVPQLEPPIIYNPMNGEKLDKDKGIRISWSPVSGCTGYYVLVKKQYGNQEEVYNNALNSTLNTYVDIPQNLLDYESSYIFVVTATKPDWRNSSASVRFTTDKKQYNVVPVSDIILDKTTITMEPGNYNTISATAIPENATNKKISFESSDANIVRVDENGSLYAVSEGTAYVIARSGDNNVVKNCLVTVRRGISRIQWAIDFDRNSNKIKVESIGIDASNYRDMSFKLVVWNTASNRYEYGNGYGIEVFGATGNVFKKEWSALYGAETQLKLNSGVRYLVGVVPATMDIVNNFDRSQLNTEILPIAYDNFNDVNKTDWYYDVISRARKEGLMNGYENGYFGPNNSLRLAELVKICLVAINPQLNNSFSGSNWYDLAMNEAVREGLLSSYYEFDMPLKQISRAEAAVILIRAAEKMDTGTIPSNYNDYITAIRDIGEISQSYQASVLKAYAAGYMVGDNGRFDGNSTLTRAQVAAIILRLRHPELREKVAINNPETNSPPVDFIPTRNFGGEIIEINAYYIPGKEPGSGYTYYKEYIDSDGTFKWSIPVTRHIIRHTFDNLGITLYELPEKPGEFNNIPLLALEGKSKGLIDKNSTGKVDDGNGGTVNVHPNFEHILDIYKLDSQYGGAQVAWQWTKAGISATSDICIVLKATKVLQVGTTTFKVVDKTGRVAGRVNDAIAIGEAGHRVFVDGADVVDTAGNLVQDLAPIWGTYRSIINAWDYAPNYILYDTVTLEADIGF